MNINEAIGAAVREHRRERRKAQKNVDYDQGGLSKVENGIQSLTFESLDKIAKSIGVRASVILATAEVMMGAKPQSDSQPERLNQEMLRDVIKVASKGGLTEERLLAAYELVVKRAASASSVVELKPPRQKLGAVGQQHGTNTGRNRRVVANSGRKGGARKI